KAAPLFVACADQARPAIVAGRTLCAGARCHLGLRCPLASAALLLAWRARVRRRRGLAVRAAPLVCGGHSPSRRTGAGAPVAGGWCSAGDGPPLFAVPAGALRGRTADGGAVRPGNGPAAVPPRSDRLLVRAADYAPVRTAALPAQD